LGTPCLSRPDAVKKTTPGGVRSGQESAKIAAAVLPALQGLEADRLNYDLVINSLNEDARHDLEPRPSG